MGGNVKKGGAFGKIGKSLLALGGLALAGGTAQRLLEKREKQQTKGAYGWLVEVRGKRMCVKVSGTGKETVVLLPGAGESSPGLVFQPLAEALGKDYTTVTVEYFGYGLSDPAPSPRTVENVAEELHELLQKLGLGKYILLAHSYSGMIALEYLNRWPEEVSAYVGIDPTAPKLIDYVDAGEANLRYRKLVGALNSVGLLRLASKLCPSVVMPEIEPERYSQSDLKLYRRLCLRAGPADDVMEELALSTGEMEKLREKRLPDSVPALQFLATESCELLEEFGAGSETWLDMHRELTGNPQSEVEVLEGGHYLQCSHPEEIAQRFHQWYTELL